MIIRQAAPTDVDQVVALMYSSGMELYDFMFSTQSHHAHDYIRLEFLSGRGLCGYPNVTVVERDGDVVATGCFYDRHAYPVLVAGGLANLLAFFGLRKGFGALARSRHVSSVMKPPSRGELYLANFGVAPALRGQGIGSVLLSEKIAAARHTGYRRFGLDVADNNPHAERLYRRHGLEQVAYKAFSGKHPSIRVPNSRKMELQL